MSNPVTTADDHKDEGRDQQDSALFPRPIGRTEIARHDTIDQYEADAAARGEYVERWPIPGLAGKAFFVRRFRSERERDAANAYRHLKLPIPTHD